jgi:hypothetical protein
MVRPPLKYEYLAAGLSAGLSKCFQVHNPQAASAQSQIGFGLAFLDEREWLALCRVFSPL